MISEEQYADDQNKPPAQTETEAAGADLLNEIWLLSAGKCVGGGEPCFMLRYLKLQR